MIGLRMDCLERIRGAENKKLRKSRDIKSHRSGVDTAAIIIHTFVSTLNGGLND